MTTRRIISIVAASLLINVIQPIQADISSFTPNDPDFPLQTQLQNNQNGMFAPEAWGINPKRGAGVIIAILSTGVDLSHPDLKGNLVAGYDFVDDDSDPTDQSGGALSGHGTAVAGIAAAQGNNRIGISGVAPNARIMPIRVLDTAGVGNVRDVADGIIYAVDHGAKVIEVDVSANVYSLTMETATQYAVAKGAVVIAPAGDDDLNNSVPNNQRYPAIHPSVISVGAVDPTLTSPWNPSPGNFGSNNGKIDVYAPGENILTTCLPGASQCDSANPYATLSGTSMAAAEVAGAAALVISSGVATIPAQVREALTCGVIMFATPATNSMGVGTLQLNFALNWKQNAVNCEIPLTNDDIRASSIINSVPFHAAISVKGRSASVAPSDPTSSCNQSVQQSHWFKFRPSTSGPFQFSTFGSSYPTAVSLYKGEPGSLVEVGCSSGYGGGAVFETQSDLTIDLTAGETYYVMISTLGAIPVDPQLLNFSVNTGILATTRIENTDKNLNYTGTWTSTSGQSGTTSQTTDNYATVSFSMRSTQITIARTTGPGYADMEVFVDGIFIKAISNHTATTVYQNQDDLFSTDQPMAMRQIVVVRDTAVPGLPIALDWAQGSSNEPDTMTAITGTADAADKRLAYWPDRSPSNWKIETDTNDVTVASTANSMAHVDFKAVGTTVIIYRNTAPGYGSMDVLVDGKLYAKVRNDNTTGSSVPYVVDNLTNAEHIISLMPDSSGGTLALESVKVSISKEAPLGVQTSVAANNFNYSGLWTTHQKEDGAFGNSSMSTTDPDGAMSFSFTGSYLGVGYATRNSSNPADDANIDVIIDGATVLSIPTHDGKIKAGTTSYGHVASTSVLALAKHTVQLKINNQGDSNAGITLDSVLAANYPTLDSSRGIIPENDPAFFYSEAKNWSPDKWSRYNGGVAEKTLTNGASIDFYFNGTGFLLYGDQSNLGGSWDIWIDNTPNTSPAVNNGNTSIFSEFNPTGLRRPLILGIVNSAIGGINVGPGVHYVHMVAHLNTNNSVTFDGMQILP